LWHAIRWGVQLLWRDLTNGYRENLNIQLIYETFTPISRCPSPRAKANALFDVI
jgi:hypothetical protein